MRKAPPDGVGRSGRVGTVCARFARDQRGQALPLLLLIVVLFVAGGVLVYQLALSTNYATVAQTAADAAALAAEQNVVQQMQTPVIINGVYQPQTIDWGKVRTVADQYAHDNEGQVIELTPYEEPWGWDVVVIASTLNGLPAISVDAAKKAYAEARASMDPLAQDSPSPTPISNDASVSTGPRFVPHTGKYGFFPVSYANYNTGAEVQIAGRLDALGLKLQLHLVGVDGYSPATSANDSDLHTCGAASTTRGLGGVTDAQLTAAGLKRMFPIKGNQPSEIALTGTTTSACVQGPAPPSAPTIGNPNVHLVPINGGPQGTFVDFPGAGFGASGGPWVIPTPIVMCESSGENQQPNSAGASGYYQIIPSTWALFGGTKYTQQAYQAPKSIQDLIAAKIWNGGAGASNWVCAQELGYA